MIRIGFVANVAFTVLILADTACIGNEANCEWDASFARLQGMGQIHALVSFDAGDGDGEQIFAGGQFSAASGKPAVGVVRYNGAQWEQAGGIANVSTWFVTALLVHDTGTGGGPHVYAAGKVTNAQGGSAYELRVLTGNQWVIVATFDGPVLALTEFDDQTGNGTELYAGGSFSAVNSLSVTSVAKWDGVEWHVMPALHFPFFLDTFPGRVVRGFAAHVGSGSALYMCGEFSLTPSGPKDNVAVWDGESLKVIAPNASFSFFDTELHAIAVHDDGSGPAVYVGGTFRVPPSKLKQGVAKWTGTQWQNLGEGMILEVHSLTSFDDGGGSALYAGGDFVVLPTLIPVTTPWALAKWNGAQWLDVGEGISGSTHNRDVRSLTVVNDGAATKLCIGGDFHYAGGESAFGAALWDGGTFTGIGVGLASDDVSVSAVETFDDGVHGPALYIGGNFVYADDQLMPCIARWNGSTWSPVGQPSLNSWTNSRIHTLHAIDGALFGSSALIAAGNFTSIGGTTGEHVAMWDGQHWTSLGYNLDVEPSSFAVHDDGSGPALFAGGAFFAPEIGPATASVVKLTDRQWLPVGNLSSIKAQCLLSLDEADGPSLYVGGSSDCCEPYEYLYRWSGGSWTSIDQGPAGAWNMALHAHDFGNGPQLVRAGGLSIIDDAISARITTLANGDWSELGWGMSSEPPNTYLSVVRCLETFDDGNGSQLYAAGSFQKADGAPASSIARWNGSQWTPLGSGLGANVAVNDMATFQGALYVGGQFENAGIQPGNSLSRWTCIVPVAGDVNGDDVVNVDDLLAVINAWGTCPASSPCPADLMHSGIVDVDDLLLVINNWS